ncbi:Dihydroxyacetone kinase 2 [Pichia californica]|uniref:Dihydroxyacetone kinase n=1 Tax=Pichia californica TaxID=460514 RepID=A0A9P6WMU4_9ASCO|nr:Dihydroxyacetone kinase 2 [[Candida] californica]KAG0689890.1 Dihydroxyacetone kinase 2 [[Candida] californica]
MPSDKHWNYEKDLVTTSINGVCLANPFLKYIEAERVVYNSKNTTDKVTILSGGGSGHEPLHLGFVGDGLLDVAVSGSIFASPSVKQIVAGINSKPSNKGTIVVVKNYTGDILHFGLASERSKAQGSNIELLIVQDDVSVGRTKNGMVGRRGLAGTLLVHKIIGAKSSIDNHSSTLEEVHSLGQRVIDNLITIGVSLDRVTVPASNADKRSKEIEEEEEENEKFDELTKDEIEIGMGIHNEHGIKRVSPIPNVEDLAETLLAYLLDPNDKERYYVPYKKDDEWVLMINNLGATSNLELYAIQSIVNDKLNDIYGIKPVRIYTGAFTTALDGPGFSITLLNVTRAGGDEILRCLDNPTTAPGWNSSITKSQWSELGSHIITEPPAVNTVSSDVKFDSKTVEKILIQGCKNVIKVEPQITLYDTVAGDGDCGETLAAGANAITNSLKNGKLQTQDAVKFFDELGDLIETAMGGTSGGLYSIFISSMGTYLKKQEKEIGGFNVSKEQFADTLEAGLTGLQKYTRARVGDRTLMDTLIPFVETFKSTVDLSKAIEAANKGAESTRKLAAKFGRASYVGEDEFKRFDSEGGLPDPGAIGLAALIKGFIEGYNSSA